MLIIRRRLSKSNSSAQFSLNDDPFTWTAKDFDFESPKTKIPKPHIPNIPPPPSINTGREVFKAFAPSLGAVAVGMGGLYAYNRYVHPKLARGLSKIGLVDKKVFTRRRRTKKGMVVVEQVRKK